MPELDIPTPSPLPSPSSSPYSLSERINIATRSTHSQLNRLILVRLPLALPPYTSNSSIYVSGLLHIAPIYITFESLWQTILDSPRLPLNLKFPSHLDACDPEQPLLDSRSLPLLPNIHSPLLHTPKVCSRTHSLLTHLRLPGLLRSGRLRADIRVLTGTPEHKIEAQLEAVSKNGRLATFLAHTKQSVEANPHVLLAYAWVMYMALFSGGRYIRASLKEAGGYKADFWNRDPSPVRPYSITRDLFHQKTSHSESPDPNALRASARAKSRLDSGIPHTVPGLQFFNFIGHEDGEDIKLEFKRRITEAEILLTAGEKEDIITEAQEIFNFMVEMVRELDSVMGTKEEDLETTKLFQDSSSLMATRDSIIVARERLMCRRNAPSEPSPYVHPSKPVSGQSVTDLEAKVPAVHFKRPLPSLDGMIKPLEKRFSWKERKQPPLVVVTSTAGPREWSTALVTSVTNLGPVLALLIVFGAWFMLRLEVLCYD